MVFQNPAAKQRDEGYIWEVRNTSKTLLNNTVQSNPHPIDSKYSFPE